MKWTVYAFALVAGVLVISYSFTLWREPPPVQAPAEPPPVQAPAEPPRATAPAAPPSSPPQAAPEAEVRASRIFAGPSQFPPEEFAAYGILAFPSRASPFTRDRHIMICHAYVATLPHAAELQVPRPEQMATVWPVSKDTVADGLNRSPQTDICEIAVSDYGLVLAKRALNDAKVAGVEVARSGPFLLAWSPSTDKGKEDALVLVSDLSDVTTYAQAQSMLLAWSRDIESDPTLWKHGWNMERLRVKIRHWVDNYGSRTLAIFGLENG